MAPVNGWGTADQLFVSFENVVRNSQRDKWKDANAGNAPKMKKAPAMKTAKRNLTLSSLIRKRPPARKASVIDGA
jgi:hypothetical protein